MTDYKCSQCDFRTDTNEIEQIIDHAYSHSNVDRFLLSRDKAKALKNFLYDNGYISYELHPIVHEIIKDLNKYLGD